MDWIVSIYYVLILFCILIYASKKNVAVDICFHIFFRDIAVELVVSSWI